MTYGEAFAVQPFGNLLVTMDLTGAQIERLLEQQADSTDPAVATVLILGVSDGFTFSYDPAGPFGDRIDPASIKLNGDPLDPAATYRIVTNNFLADGGDGFTVFTEGTNRIGGGDDLAALIDYLGATPRSPHRGPDRRHLSAPGPDAPTGSAAAVGSPRLTRCGVGPGGWSPRPSARACATGSPAWPRRPPSSRSCRCRR